MIEGIDYFIYFVKFPNTEGAALVTPNDDGTYTILVNNQVSESRQQRAIRHEIKHIEEGHFYLNDVSVDHIEIQAHE